MPTSFAFTAAQLAEISRLRDELIKPENVRTLSAAVPLYSYVLQCVTGTTLPTQAALLLLPEDQRKSALWLIGATQVNASSGAFSKVIREFNVQQGRLRGRGVFGEGILQEASNAVGLLFASSILDAVDQFGDANQSQGRLSTVQEIGNSDLLGVRNILYPGNNSETSELYLNQAWPGIVMLGALGGKYTDRLLQVNERDPVKIDTLLDLKALLFCWDSFKVAFQNTPLTATSLTDVMVSFNLAPTLIPPLINTFTTLGVTPFARALFSTLIQSQDPTARDALNLISTLDSSRFLDMIMGALQGKTLIGTTTDASFTTTAQTFFNLAPATLQSLSATLLTQGAPSVAALARTDVNVRSALAASSAVSVQVSNEVAQRFSLYDPTTGTGEVTNRWIEDRSKALTAFMLYWQGRETDGVLSVQSLGVSFPFPQVGDTRIVVEGDTAASALQLTVDGLDGLIVVPTLRYFGNDANNTRTGDANDDHLFGGFGNDTLSGLAGNDYLEGNAGNDSLVGGSGKDEMLGGVGDDTLDGGGDADLLIGGAGIDTYTFTGAYGSDDIIDSDGLGTISVDGNALTGGSKVGDGFYRNATTGWTYALAGTSLVIRKDGSANSIMVRNWQPGQLGIQLNNTLIAPVTGSTYLGDFIKATNPANPTQYLRDGVNYVSAGAQVNADDVITGSAGADSIVGGGGNDGLAGLAGDDVIDGGIGDDLLIGGLGADTLIGGAGKDFIFGSGAGGLNYLDRTTSAPPVPSSGTVYTRGFSWVTSYTGLDANSIGIYQVFGANTVGLADDAGNVIDGGAGEDFIFAGSGADFVHGGDDDDYIAGLAGGDIIFGDAGNDRIRGDGTALPGYVGTVPAALHGNDVLDGGIGNDTLVGQGGDDQLLGGIGNDLLLGDDDNASETPLAVNGRDYLDGGDGLDTLRGGGSDDTLFGGSGADFLYGDSNSTNLPGVNHGNDVMDGESGNDYLEGGGGTDTLFGGTGNDVLWGDVDAQFLDVVFHGADYLNGEDGNDTLVGGSNNDELVGGTGDDDLYGDNGGINGLGVSAQGADTLDGGDGDDYLQGEGNADLLIGGNGADTLYGDAPNARLPMEANGNDDLQGGAGADVLRGGGGNDTLDGGTDDDYLYGDDETSVVGAAGHGKDWLDGGAGNDTLSGGGNDDYLFGGDGNDFLAGEDENSSNAVSTLTGNDTLDGGAGDDALLGGNGNDDLDGGSGGDSLFGGAGNDTLRGGADADYLDGGAGDDTYVLSFEDIQVVAGEADVIVDNLGTNTIQLGVSSSALELQPISFDGAALLVVDPQHQLFVLGALTGGIDAIQFADQRLSMDRLIAQRYAAQVVASVTTANGKAYGGTAADTITVSAAAASAIVSGGRGNDVISLGATGGATVLFSLGDGVDRIRSGYELGTPVRTGQNVLQLGADITPYDIRLSRLAAGQYSLAIGWDGNDAIVFAMDDNDVAGIASRPFDRFAFRDHAPLSWQQLLDRGIEIRAAGSAPAQISGTNGRDRIFGSGGNDTINGLVGNDTISGGAGNDLIDAGAGEDSIQGGDGNDTIKGGADFDILLGGAGNDLLQGNEQGDYMDGELGNDTLDGGPGDDVIRGGAGADVYLFGRGSGQDTVDNYDGEAFGINPDTIQLGAGITTTDITLTRVTGYSDDLVISLKGSTDSLRVRNYFLDDGAMGYVFEHLAFADGTVWGDATVKANLSTAAAPASLWFDSAATDGVFSEAFVDPGVDVNNFSGIGTANDTALTPLSRTSTDAIAVSESLDFGLGNTLGYATINDTALTFSGRIGSSRLDGLLRNHATLSGLNHQSMDAQVDTLVSAMAAFAPPAVGQPTFRASEHLAYRPMATAHWQ